MRSTAMLGMLLLYENRSASTSSVTASRGAVAPRSSPQAPSANSIEPHSG